MSSVTIAGRPPAKPHPGKGEKRGRFTPRGRQVPAEALLEVRDALGEAPRRRDLLIEHLHLLQERFGHLKSVHLAALAEELRLAQTEVFEVATFYAHFDVVREGETPPPPVTVRVCESITCEMLGARDLLAGLQAAVDKRQVRVVPAPCMGACDRAPAVHDRQAAGGARERRGGSGRACDRNQAPRPTPYPDLDAYRAGGGYALYRRIKGDGPPIDLLAGLTEAGLRGLGGAGFVTGKKWEIVKGQPAPRYMAVNADEGEPGTFKDRFYLERDPHRFLEGC